MNSTVDLQASLGELNKLFTAQQFEQILDQARPLIAQWPDVALLHSYIGYALFGLKRFDAARQSFEAAVRLNEKEESARLGLGQSLRALGRNDESVPFLLEHFRLHPNRESGTDLLRAAFDARQQDPKLISFVFRSLYKALFHDRPGYQAVMTPFTPLADWCASNSVPMVEVDPGGEIRLHDSDGKPIVPYQADPVRFATIPGASIVAGMDWVIAPTGEVLDRTGLTVLADWTDPYIGGEMFVPFAADPPRRRVLHGRSIEEVFVDEDVLFLSAPRLHHFGHWMYDYLTRLRVWRHPDSPARKIFTLANLPRAQRETTTYFDVHPNDLFEAEVGQTYRFRSVTALHLPDAHSPTPSTVNFVTKGLSKKQAPLPGGAKGRRIYLERSQTARGRNIHNKAEFEALLAEFGFESVRRPERTVAEQNEIFSEAETILSPFGTDLVTWHQLRPGTDFIVLDFENMETVYPHENLTELAERYCAIQGLRLHFVHCGLKPRKGWVAYHGDMSVDCGVLRQTLSGIISRRAGAGAA